MGGGGRVFCILLDGLGADAGGAEGAGEAGAGEAGEFESDAGATE